MTESAMELKARVSLASEMKEMIANKWARNGALIAVAGTSLIGYASATIDFTNISELLQAVVTLIPDLMDLVIGIAPLLVTIAIIAFVIGFLKSILEWIRGAW
jgi:uncharacterized membrane protein